MSGLEAERLKSEQSGISRAAALLRDGQLVAFPTETVYGLGGDARSPEAVARIFAAKGRPAFNPLIVHVSSLDAAQDYVDLSEDALKLAQAFWPGPLTLVLPARNAGGIAAAVSAGLPTLAVRVPRHPVAQALLAAFDGPVAAPSANPSGRISPTTSTHVATHLGDRIAAVLDGGAAEVGLESTIVTLTPEPMLLREGGIPREELEHVLGRRLSSAPKGSDAPQSPGQLLSHYAPKVALRLNATEARAGETLLGFGPIAGEVSLSSSGDLDEAAGRLFACLHRLDAIGAPIAVAPIPDIGLGRAINDRLRRAAAPRD